jgi:hypothetical protein
MPIIHTSNFRKPTFSDHFLVGIPISKQMAKLVILHDVPKNSWFKSHVCVRIKLSRIDLAAIYSLGDRENILWLVKFRAFLQCHNVPVRLVASKAGMSLVTDSPLYVGIVHGGCLIAVDRLSMEILVSAIKMVMVKYVSPWSVTIDGKEVQHTNLFWTGPSAIKLLDDARFLSIDRTVVLGTLGSPFGRFEIATKSEDIAGFIPTTTIRLVFVHNAAVSLDELIYRYWVRLGVCHYRIRDGDAAGWYYVEALDGCARRTHDKDFSGALAALLSIVRQDFLDGLIKPPHGHKLLKYTKLEGHLLDARRNILKI